MSSNVWNVDALTMHWQCADSAIEGQWSINKKNGGQSVVVTGQDEQTHSFT